MIDITPAFLTIVGVSTTYNVFESAQPVLARCTKCLNCGNATGEKAS